MSTEMFLFIVSRESSRIIRYEKLRISHKWETVVSHNNNSLFSSIVPERNKAKDGGQEDDISHIQWNFRSKPRS